MEFGSPIEVYFENLLNVAREVFNEGKSGDGRKYSLMRKCVKIHNKVRKVYINGTYATTEALSWYNMPAAR